MTIFVANLFWEITPGELEQLFAPYGTVDRVQIITDRPTGRSRGFGFVDMPNATQAQAAITALNGTLLYRRPLTVSESRPRADQGGPQHHGDGQRRPRW